MSSKRIILGAGVTGLAAGLASGLPIYEAANDPGGICSSYYVRPEETQRLSRIPTDKESYHFEIGGGHWIFGGDPAILRFIHDLTPVKSYGRKSSVYFPEKKLYVPYPLQNHLRFLDQEVAGKALAEMAAAKSPYRTMKEWMEQGFGQTLCDSFFYPFHELYTAGLYKKIAPQDDYKSPVNISAAIRGAFDQVAPAGYNVSFVYPQDGLNTLAQRMAERCEIRYGKRAVQLDVQNKEVHFADGTSQSYETLLSTLPLNRMLEITGVSVDAEPDPHTSVLVLNIGAIKGQRCPEDHWIYVPHSNSGFHRVGFYSNVDSSFLPVSGSEKRVSIYVERAYLPGQKPSEAEIQTYCQAVAQELQEWGYVEEVEVNDPTWIEVAYTWSWPGSNWKQKALRALEEKDIIPVGRYGRWVFQGIADSIKDGFYVGASVKDYLPTRG